MKKKSVTTAQLQEEIEALRSRAMEAEETLRAIREGEVDAIVVSGGKGERIFSLSTSDSVYRMIVETMQEAAVTVASPEGTILFGNGQCADMLRLSPTSIIGKHLSLLVEPSDREAAERILTRARQAPVKARISLHGAKGPIPVLVSASRLAEPTGTSICLVLSDLTELENSTVLIEKFRVQQRIAESVMARLRIIGMAAATFLKSPDPQLALSTVCGEVGRLLDCEVFLNYELSKDGEHLVLKASSGIPRQEFERFERLETSDSVCGKAAKSAGPLVLRGIRENRQPHVEHLRLIGVDAYMCVPLSFGGKPRGTLSFGTKKNIAFTQDDMSLVQTVADQAAVALDRHDSEVALAEANANLEEMVARRTQELENQMARLRSMALELSTAEQRERRRIAGVLHDDLQQILVGMHYHLDSLTARCNEAMLPSMKSVTRLLDQSIALTRSLTSELTPATLSKAGFPATLRWLADWAGTRHGLSVQIVGKEDGGAIPEHVALLLAESVRELLFNVVKHSGVKSATITHALGPEEIQLTVADDGKGFDPAAASRGKSFGLFSISERIGALGGRLEITSALDKGSTFTLVIPRAGLEDTT